MKRALLIASTLLLVLFTAACGDNLTVEESESNEPMQQFSSMSMLAGNEVAMEPIVTESPSTIEDNMLQELAESLNYDKATGSLSFTIPQNMEDDMCSNLLVGVVGRLHGNPDWSQTWPYFSQANLDGFVAGETYAGTIHLENVDYVAVTIALFDTPDYDGNCVAKISATIDGDGIIAVNPVEM